MREIEQQVKMASVSAGTNLRNVVQNYSSSSSSYAISSGSTSSVQNDSGAGGGPFIVFFLIGSFFLYQFLSSQKA